MNNNHDERNELELNAEQRLQALVCAYVLGEASDAERAEVEGALAKSAELRELKARFEQAAPLVAGALKERAGEALSPGSKGALDAAVARRARPTFFAQPIVRLAAGVAVAAGAWALYQSSQTRPMESLNSDGVETAALERDGRNPAPATLAEPELEAPGAVAADKSKARGTRELAAGEELKVDVSAGRPAAGASPSDPAAGGSGATRGEPQGAPSEKPGAQSPGGLTDVVSVSAATGDALAGLAQASEGAPKNEGASTEGKSGAYGGGEVLGLDFDAETAQAAQVDALSVGAPTEAAPGRPTAGAPVTKSSGSDEFFLGQAGGAGGGAAPSGEVAGAPTSGGRIDMRGLDMPPAAPGSPPAPARGQVAGAPSSPGPAGANTPGASKGAGEKLVELGYGDGGGNGSSADDHEDPVLKDAEVESRDRLDEKKKGEDVAGDQDFSADAPTNMPERFKDIRRRLSDDEQLRKRYDHLRAQCIAPWDGKRPRDMFFRYWGDNPFELALLDRQSTFSVDVDTASYTLARRYLVENQLPTKEQVRTEEFVNYFKGDVPPPTEGTFAVATEFAPSLFGGDNNAWMLRVAVRGKEVSKSERQPVALTFVVDVSGSMREGARLELVKHSLRLLVSQLDPADSISLVKFSSDAALILPMTSARHKDLIESAIHPLQPEGSTNTEAGLRMGYEQALAALTPRANNRVVLLTDGVANVGLTDPNALVAMVERQRQAGIYLNTVGVGMNNVNDNLLEQLANKGDGLCNYVDDEQEVRRALVENFTGAFQVIARDVKVQVEFDPAQVERYRLLGYENRAIADADFRNDKVDAGEIGAGHQVVALYEVVRRNVTGDGPLATVRLRWKQPFQVGVPENEQPAVQEIAHNVLAKSAAAAYAATSPGYRRSVLVAQFAEFLRRSVHARTDSLDRLIDEARKLAGELRDKDFDEFVDMLTRSHELVRLELARRDWLQECGDLLRHRRFLHCQLDELYRRYPSCFDDAQAKAHLEGQLREIELRLAELEQRLAAPRGVEDNELIARLQKENIELQRQLLAQLDTARQASETDGK
jgi:Ca-activated chloride channel family protein